MNGKGFSLIIVSHDNKVTIRRYISSFTIKVLIGFGAALIGFIVFLILSYLPVYYRAVQVEYFARRNREIEEDFKALSEIKTELAVARRENMKIRQMLGVAYSPKPIDVGNLSPAYNPATQTNSPSNIKYRKNVPSIAPALGMLSNDYDLTHRGVDIAAPLGTIVVAPADGMVEEVGWDSIYGNYVKIKHNDLYTTFYGHLQTTFVTLGQEVTQNDIIAHVGSSGRSTAPHLHYVLLFKGEPTDPKAYIK